MDDMLLALTGVILQVLGLHVALLNVLLGAAGLVVKLVSKDLPRSSDKDDPGHSTYHPNRQDDPRAVGS